MANLNKNFSTRCNTILLNICSWLGNDYLNDSTIDANGWIIRGKNHDFIARFDHEPSDKEIHNAICNAQGMYHKVIL